MFFNEGKILESKCFLIHVFQQIPGTSFYKMSDQKGPAVCPKGFPTFSCLVASFDFFRYLFILPTCRKRVETFTRTIIAIRKIFLDIVDSSIYLEVHGLLHVPAFLIISKNLI